MLVYAIDFGTSNSLLAASDGTQIFDPIPLDAHAPDPTVLRSLLYFPSHEKCFYGSEAIARFQDHQGEGRFIRSIKKQLPVRSFIGTWIGDRPANLEDLIGFFLSEMRRRANKHFGADGKAVVLGRPARFSADDADDGFAEFRLKEAAKRAGFERIEFCPEPLAAAYEFASTLDEAKTVLVADFGGGTSDYTVIRIKNAKAGEVLSLGGVNVAGDRLDGTIMRHRLVKYFGADLRFQVPFGTNVLRMPSHLMEKLCSPADISLLGKRDVMEFFRNVQKWAVAKVDREMLERLMVVINDQLGFPLFEAIEKSKRVLSASDEAEIRFDYPTLDLRELVQRAEFETFASSEIQAIVGALDRTVKESGLTPKEIDLVCCTGGTAKVPAIQKALIERFGPEKVKEHRHFHSVVQGLAHRAKEMA